MNQEGIFMTELELLRAILDSYPYAIVYVDSDFIIRYMNRYARYHYCVERRSHWQKSF